jgi:hypothetical protein
MIIIGFAGLVGQSKAPSGLLSENPMKLIGRMSRPNSQQHGKVGEQEAGLSDFSAINLMMFDLSNWAPVIGPEEFTQIEGIKEPV